MDQMLNGAEHTNFFENRATEYARASTEGDWEDAFSDDVFSGNYGKKIGAMDLTEGGDDTEEAA
ncbi:MAG: ribonucleotide-diphosphate reductase subunit beta, partial [Pseudomonadota bacterium]|nr:ribonucleotide-diphosphate reductase subunit beta [Pseudomonadota bacterium]